MRYIKGYEYNGGISNASLMSIAILQLEHGHPNIEVHESGFRGSRGATVTVKMDGSFINIVLEPTYFPTGVLVGMHAKCIEGFEFYRSTVLIHPHGEKRIVAFNNEDAIISLLNDVVSVNRAYYL